VHLSRRLPRPIDDGSLARAASDAGVLADIAFFPPGESDLSGPEPE
jgi:hypothetical protein